MKCQNCGTHVSDNQKICNQCGVNLSSQTTSQSKPMGKRLNVSKRHRVMAVLWLILPGVVLGLVLLLYAILATATSAISTDSAAQAVSILKMTLGLLGVLSFISIIAGIPLAIYFGRKRTEPISEFDERSGKGEESEFPLELKKWNWGAAGLPMIWGAYHSVWWCFFTMIPYVNWIWWIIMGIEGNKWAWQKRYWKNIDEFKQAQKKWKPWGIIFLFFPIIIAVLFMLIGIIAALV